MKYQVTSKYKYGYHLAANADVRFGLKHTKKDINQIIVTAKILEAMRKHNVKK